MDTFHDNRKLTALLAALLLTAGVSACNPQSATSTDDKASPSAAQTAAPRPVEMTRVTVPQGTEVHVSLSTAVGSATSNVGDTLRATTLTPVVIGDRVAIPVGSTISGRVTEVDTGKKGLKVSEKGGSVLLSFDTVTTPSGAKTPISASIASIAGSKGKTGGIIGGSAAGGALLGKILGGSSKDAAIGAVVGGGIGTAIAAGTKGGELKIPAGTELTMTLDQTVSIASNR